MVQTADGMFKSSWCRQSDKYFASHNLKDRLEIKLHFVVKDEIVKNETSCTP